MRKATSALALGLLLSGAARADPPAAAPGGDLEAVLIVSAKAVAPGQPSRVTLLLANPTDRPRTARFEPTLSCRLESPGGTLAVRAEARPAPGDTPSEIPPGGFVQHEYVFTVPEDARGPVAFGCEGVGAPPAALRVAAGEEAEARGGRVEVLREGIQEFASRFAAFDPFYFLVGVDPSKSKFQLSFDYHFLSPEGSLAERHPWVTGFHFAYTQTSLWDLASESVPFRDTSYKPELHFISPEIPWKPRWLDRLRVRVGFQHESNGRGGSESRSTNFLYAKPMLVFGRGEPWSLEVGPKAWIYVANDDTTNRALPDYRGYFDLELDLTRARSFQLATHLGWAQEGPTVQVDFTYPLAHLLAGNLDLYFQAQYFNGFAETLLRFDERNQAFRLGLAMLR